MPSPSTTSEASGDGSPSSQRTLGWAKKKCERGAPTQEATAPSLEAALLSIARKVQAELLRSIQAEARALLDSVSCLQVQGKRQLMMLDRLEEMIGHCSALGAGGLGVARSCDQREGGAIAATYTSYQSSINGRSDSRTPAGALHGASTPGEGLALDGESLASRVRHSSFCTALEPVMPTPPEAITEVDDLSESPARSPTLPGPEQNVYEESCLSESGRAPAKDTTPTPESGEPSEEHKMTDMAFPALPSPQALLSPQKDSTMKEQGAQLNSPWRDDLKKSHERLLRKIQTQTTETLARDSSLQRLVRSRRFEIFCGVMIGVNTLLMGLEANYSALNPDKPCSHTFVILDLLFTLYFTAEMLVRMAAFRMSYFINEDWRWNWLDLFLVVSSVSEEMIRRFTMSDICEEAQDIGKGMDAVSIVRALRLIRILRTLRMLQFVRELRIMIQSALECILPLCYALILLLMIQWSFGIYFVRMSADFFHDVTKEPTLDILAREAAMADIRQNWGSIWVACYTLFKSITGGIDWESGADIMLAMGIAPILVFVVYISLTVFVFLNVVTGVFVEHAMKIILRDRDLRVDMEIEQQKDCARNLVKIFIDVDADCNGLVNAEEFESGLDDENVQAALESLGLTVVEARRLFRLLDTNNSGFVDQDEFVTGCMSLRGTAKTMDVVSLMSDFQNFAPCVSSEISQLRSITDEIQRRLQNASVA